jgi:hypothetical protein
LHKRLRGVFNLIVGGALEHLCEARHERSVAVETVGKRRMRVNTGGALKRGSILNQDFEKVRAPSNLRAALRRRCTVWRAPRSSAAAATAAAAATSCASLFWGALHRRGLCAHAARGDEITPVSPGGLWAVVHTRAALQVLRGGKGEGSGG